MVLMVIKLLDQTAIVYFCLQQAPLILNIRNIMNVDIIRLVTLVTKIAIGMLCVFNLTNSNSVITALTQIHTKVLLFAP